MKIVVPISGGKDSQACLKLAIQEVGRNNVIGLFCDTKFEHPITYKHIDTMKKLYKCRIDTVCGGSVIEKCVKYKRFPGGGARFCTEELKMRETKLYCYRLADEYKHGFILWYGMRVGESVSRKKKYNHVTCADVLDMNEVFPSKYPKKLAKMGIFMRLPIADWNEDDVFSYLCGEHNPLYDHGFDRVGCFPCLAAGDRYKDKAFTFDSFGESQREKVAALEVQFGKTVFSNTAYDSSGCMLCAI